MKKLTCSVCGTEFIAQKKEHYVSATDNVGSGLSRLVGSTTSETYYDSLDCPQCGCQMRVNNRLMEVPAKDGDGDDK